MFKKLSCIAVVILCFILCCCIFAGCGNKYNAIFYDRANKWVSEEFLNENRVNAYYKNENYDEDYRGDESIYADEYYYDDTAPESRTFIINDEEQFKSIFTGYPDGIAFENRTVILYIRCSISATRLYLKKVEIHERTASIYYKAENSSKKARMTMPSPRCYMVILDKVDINSAEFICV